MAEAKAADEAKAEADAKAAKVACLGVEKKAEEDRIAAEKWDIYRSYRHLTSRTPSGKNYPNQSELIFST